jgi:uncharacterized protein (TIGR00730 family)
MARAICVFAGSSLGSSADFLSAAAALGRQLVASGYSLVYGGAHVGLMGVVADAVLAEGGRAIGVIPDFLVEKELAHHGLSELKIVSTMHERKQTMVKLSDGFIALPGGFGTIEEFFEVLTWGQLRLHWKPCGLLNVAVYYDDLLRFLDNTVSHRLVTPENRAMIAVEDDPRKLLERFSTYRAPTTSKWIRADRT